MIRKRIKQWLAYRKLARLTAARRKQFIIEHPEYETRRQASKLGWQRRRAM